MTKQVILVGEVRVGTGCVHQSDFAVALGAERLTAWPKNADDVELVVGKLLANRKPALLVKGEKNGLEPVTVDSLLTPEVRQRLVGVLSAKPALAPYERVALEHLKATTEKPSALDHQVLADVFPMPKKHRGRRSKARAVA
jgi:hypothetical protein